MNTSEPTAQDAKKIYRVVLDRAERELKEQCNLIRQVISHNGEKGGQIERTVQAALRRVLPPRIGVGSGFVVDAQGKNSKQLDIILYDRDGTPAIFADGELLVLPAECVYAAGEVKTFLDRAAIEDSVCKCESFKTLSREARFERSGVIVEEFLLYGQNFSYWPPIFFVISLTTTGYDTFHQNASLVLGQSEARIPRPLGVDVICSLDGLMKVNTTPATPDTANHTTISPLKVNLCAEPGQSWATYPTKSPWVLFVTLLNTVITQAPSTRVDLLQYQDDRAF